MIKGPGMFNKAASLSYKSLNQTERAQLKEACIKESSKEERMSAMEVMREGKKVFSKIQCLVINYIDQYDACLLLSYCKIKEPSVVF